MAAAAGSTTVFYTPAVVNTPRGMAQDMLIVRHRLRARAIDVWAERSLEIREGSVSADVEPHGVVLLVLEPATADVAHRSPGT